MSTEDPRAAMAKAFRETTLSLIGLFQIYEVDHDLTEATAEVLRKLFLRHLQDNAESARERRHSPMHSLADELDQVADRAA